MENSNNYSKSQKVVIDNHNYKKSKYGNKLLSEHQALTIFIRKWLCILYMYRMNLFQDEELSYIFDIYHYDRFKIKTICDVFRDQDGDRLKVPYFVSELDAIFKKIYGKRYDI